MLHLIQALIRELFDWRLVRNMVVTTPNNLVEPVEKAKKIELESLPQLSQISTSKK